MVYVAPRRILRRYKAMVILLSNADFSKALGTHIIILVLWKHLEELFKEKDHLIGHVVELMNVAVRINIAEACPYRIIDKKNVGKFIPGSVVVSESRFIL